MNSAQQLLDLYLEVCRQYDEERYGSAIRQFHELKTDDDDSDDDDEENVAGELLRLALETPGAMSLVGLCHLYGYGTPRSEALAVDWFRRASSAGEPSGMFLLGISLLPEGAEGHPFPLPRGEGIPRDPVSAVEWFRKSADLGNPLAMDALGRCHEHGVGVAEDRVKAIEWYRKAIDHGAFATRSSVIRLLLRGDDPVAGIRYLVDVHRATTDSDAKTRSRSVCDDLQRNGDLVETEMIAEIVLRWRGLEVESDVHRARIEALEAENETLRTELNYRPGGLGYLEAQTDFASIAHETVPSSPAPSSPSPPFTQEVT